MNNGRKLTNLADVPVGFLGTIDQFTTDEMPVKLLEMGLLPGNDVLVKNRAPFHGPLHVQVSGYNLALRKEEAAFLLVSNVRQTDSTDQ